MGEMSQDAARSGGRQRVDEARSERDKYAPFWTRGIGFAVDWTVSFFLPSILSGLALGAVGASGGLLEWLWIAFLCACVLAYFTVFTLRGRTLGMMATGIRILDQETMSPPDLPRALARGVMALLLIGSWFVILLTGIYDSQSDGQSGLQRAINYGAIGIFALSVFGKLLMVIDPYRQTLQDKLTRLVVIRQAEEPSGTRG